MKNKDKYIFFPTQIAEVPDDEAVRIFLEFERVESAIKGQCLPLRLLSFSFCFAFQQEMNFT